MMRSSALALAPAEDAVIFGYPFVTGSYMLAHEARPMYTGMLG
jgi:hypothetical protein